MRDSEMIERELLAGPPDTTTMRILADALEDEGELSLATAYRWATERGRWPFKRHARLGRPERIESPDADGMVYDWDRDWHAYVPEPAGLPRPIYDAIRKLPNRQYGTVRQAFVLLARALEAIDAGPTETVNAAV